MTSIPHFAAAVAAALLASVPIASCGEDPTHSAPSRFEPLGLTRGPPSSLIEACRSVSHQTNLIVYCPPVVPKGPVIAPSVKKRQGNALVYGEHDTYTLSLGSRSLAPSESKPGTVIDAGHWVVAAYRPAHRFAALVDRRARYPNASGHAGQRRRHFTADGVRATVITGNTTGGAGFASSDHAIVYWKVGGIGYLVSVHDRFPNQRGGVTDQSRHYAPITTAIARGLIGQMTSCSPRSSDDQPSACGWVYRAR